MISVYLLLDYVFIINFYVLTIVFYTFAADVQRKQ